MEVWQEAQDEARPDWLHYMDQAEVDCLAANAYTELALASAEPRRWRRYAARAEQHTANARAARVPGYTRSRILDEIRLARVRLSQREPAEAAAVATGALRLAEEARSSLVVDWFVRFDAALARRHPDCREAAEFHDRLRDHLRRAAPHGSGRLSEPKFETVDGERAADRWRSWRRSTARCTASRRTGGARSTSGCSASASTCSAARRDSA